MEIKNLFRRYQEKKDEIKKRLEEFKQIINESDERIFAELAFCLCTPQSKATVCWNAVEALMKNNLLYVGNEEQILPFLNVVRFNKNKAKYIVENRNFFTENGKLNLKEKIKSFNNIFELRNWLAKNVKGFGLKESSHFIRSIGLSNNQIAILDRHVLKNLYRYGVINGIPKSLSKKLYLEIENKMKKFAEKIKIPMDELDLLFWSEETGMIFK